MGKKKISRHRFLFNKASLLREAGAALVKDPSEPKREYLRGLADALHGTQCPETARAIHVARQVILATKDE